MSLLRLCVTACVRAETVINSMRHEREERDRKEGRKEGRKEMKKKGTELLQMRE